MPRLFVVLLLSLFLFGCGSNDDDMIVVVDPSTNANDNPANGTDDPENLDPIDEVETPAQIARRLVIGSWVYTDEATECTETQTFGADNTYKSVELDEETEGRYVIAPNDDEALPPIIIVRIETTNAQANCNGENILETEGFVALIGFPSDDEMTFGNVANDTVLQYSRITAE